MEILTTREWATVIWAFILFVYAMVHRQIREAFWNVVKIFFGKKLRILWGIIFLYVLGITLIFYQLPFWDNAFIKDIILSKIGCKFSYPSYIFLHYFFIILKNLSFFFSEFFES